MNDRQTWRKDGYCNAHNGYGYKLNLVYPTGLVGAFYKFKREGWVCDACWKHYHISTSEEVEP